ncbi:MAG: photosystem II protein Y [Candidatus Portnoybacteria bacterium]|nr:photosystem II protein Y [Candidatus Portnoybacteria bacterium]MDD4983126.1 photosystem II protein Y [Candidatus Portnoybacteria bacterium]
MKKLIVLIIIVLAGGWALQNYTSFRAMDYAKDYWQKVDWSKINVFSRDKAVPDASKQLNIFIKESKFTPNFSAAESGIKATWFNEDDEKHTVTGDSWGSGEIAPGKAYSKIFNEAGTYKYHCSIHPSMTGEIIVK